MHVIGHVTVRRRYNMPSFQSHDSSEFDRSIFIDYILINLNHFLNKFLSPPPPSKSNSSKRFAPPFVVGTSDWLFTWVGSDWILKSSNKFTSFFVSTGELFTGLGTFSCVGCSEGDKVADGADTAGSGATTGEAS